jgi:hypothetical protein
MLPLPRLALSKGVPGSAETMAMVGHDLVMEGGASWSSCPGSLASAMHGAVSLVP